MKILQRVLVIVLVTTTFVNFAWSQSLPPGVVWSYTLVNGSSLLDDCPICGRVSIPLPMRGTFQLRLVLQGPLFITYAMDNISFTASGNGRTYKVTGQGVFQIGGEIATQETATLQLLIDDGVSNKACYFTNSSGAVTRLWPMIQVSSDQTNGTSIQQFHLDIGAAPFRELWFSTTQRFQTGIWKPPTNVVGAGDLVSWLGHEVKSDAELIARLGIQFAGTDLGLKDIDILPGGEIAFSLAQAAFSSTLGTLHPGDIVSDQGRLLRTNLSLVSAFVPAAPFPPDFGVAALKLMPDGETWFSTQTNFFSKILGRMLQPGDLLSDNGTLVRSNAQLLAQFTPANPTNDYGLNSIYVWPSGEIWFSTAKGLLAANSNYYDPGDLLSDQGYLVYSNSELLAAFAPSNAPPSLGLDALYIVTDVTAISAPPQLEVPQVTNFPPFSLAFQFKTSGRVFQLERAQTLDAPFLPVLPISTATHFIDPGVLREQSQGLYRVHQW
jgi:hypothetical protein